MQLSSKGRRSLYLRVRKDSDLIQYINPLLNNYDFSDIVRDLMRDGIRYRNKGEQTNVLRSNQFAQVGNKGTLDDVQITKKEVNKDDLRERMDGFLEQP